MNRKGKRRAETYKGMKIIEATGKTLEGIQDDSEVVIVGSDSCALYPSLTDIEVALMCFNAIMNTDV